MIKMPFMKAKEESTAEAGTKRLAPAGKPKDAPVEISDPAVEVNDFSLWYGNFRAVTDVSIKFPRKKITAVIGPSGCGKSTLLRAVNRMNELIGGVRSAGNVMLEGANIYADSVDPVEVRRRIGMVFQKPNPFPRSIRDNILFGARVNGYQADEEELVEAALRSAALWDEVNQDLKQSGLALSGGQQQRLCIARAIAVSPEVLLMDEPCSALDPIATLKIEDLMRELAKDFTIIIVTHNMQQAARVSDYTAFMLSDDKARGKLIEFGPTADLFTNPTDERTEAYITGRFG